jgi:hypothetical protein
MWSARLRDRVRAVNSRNLTDPEATLVAQAHTLDVLFAHLTRRAVLNMGHALNATETYFRLALKAQSQCRATLQTLADIKNPPTIFARQANITNGPQQVNNGTCQHLARENSEIKPNELLEHENDPKHLVLRAPRSTSGSDSTMATVDTINRSAHAKRKARRKP